MLGREREQDMKGREVKGRVKGREEKERRERYRARGGRGRKEYMEVGVGVGVWDQFLEGSYISCSKVIVGYSLEEMLILREIWYNSRQE